MFWSNSRFRSMARLAALALGLTLGVNAGAAILTQTRTTAATVTPSGGWGTPANAAAIDGTCATPDGSTSTALTITGWNFAIPAGSTIVGIAVRSRSSFNDTSTQDQIRLTKAGAAVGAARILNGDGSLALPTCGAWVGGAPGLTVGGAADLWGTTWTVAEINAVGFGAFYDNDFFNTFVDGLEITVSFDDNTTTPPTITKSFGAATVALNGTTSMVIAIQNPNPTGLTGIDVSDTFPAGLVVANPNGLANTCGGAATASAGTGLVSLTGATLAASASCSLTVNVQGTTAGVKNNTTGAVTSTEGGTGGTGSASVTIVAPPTIAKSFGAPSIALNGTTTMTIALTNPNPATALSGIGVSDTFPAGLVVATPNGLVNTCGGAATAVAGTGVVSLTGTTLAASASCSVTVNVQGTAAGVQNNTTGAVTSTEGGAGGTGSASVTVVAPPTIAKSFSPIAVTAGSLTTLTFTLTNPAANTVVLTGVGFTDPMPSGLAVPNSSTGACGGTVTTTGPSTIVLAGATIAVGGTCQFSVSVIAFAVGSFTNTTNVVSSVNGGTGSAASGDISVLPPPLIPTLSGWALAMLVAMLGLAMLFQLRRRRG